MHLAKLHLSSASKLRCMFEHALWRQGLAIFETSPAASGSYVVLAKLSNLVQQHHVTGWRLCRRAEVQEAIRGAAAAKWPALHHPEAWTPHRRALHLVRPEHAAPGHQWKPQGYPAVPLG